LSSTQKCKTRPEILQKARRGRGLLVLMQNTVYHNIEDQEKLQMKDDQAGRRESLRSI